MQLQKRLSSLLVGPLVALPVACLLTLALNWPARRALYESSQAGAVNYQSFDPYKLAVLEGPVNWTTLPWSRRYRLSIGKAADSENTYGYSLDYSFHPFGADTSTYIRQSRVLWEAGGVTFIEASGQRLFVPKKLFVGGR